MNLSRTARVIRARPEQVYAAFIDPAILITWLPPAGMAGEFHEFDARVGGGYTMSLFYPPGEQAFRGKTTDKEDRVVVRFVELSPPHKIVETVNFITSDPAFLGEMRHTVTLDAVAGGTEVTLLFEDLPPGLRREDNDAGARLSLENLARLFDAPGRQADPT
jgi:uncharacterized protein YndB with AHSA1/START domain